MPCGGGERLFLAPRKGIATRVEICQVPLCCVSYFYSFSFVFFFLSSLWKGTFFFSFSFGTGSLTDLEDGIWIGLGLDGWMGTTKGNWGDRVGQWDRAMG